MKIMIVDDNNRVRTMLRKILGTITSDFCEATDGLDAVEKYSQAKPDVVLMDIRMPLMDGIEATEMIVQKDPDAKVCIVTEYDDLAFRNKAERAGAIKYFLKDNLIALQDYIKTTNVNLN